jgi:hypothetical protein
MKQSRSLYSGELGGHIPFNWWFIRLGLQPVLGVHNNSDILGVRTMISVVLAVCLLILIKKIYHQIRK